MSKPFDSTVVCRFDGPLPAANVYPSLFESLVRLFESAGPTELWLGGERLTLPPPATFTEDE